MCTAGVAAIVAPAAQAISLPMQDSRKGTLPKNTSSASMSSYGMEGIKKQGIDRKRRDAVLGEAKERALQGK